MKSSSKSRSKRLSLNTETVRDLDRREIGRMVVGASTGPCKAVDEWFYLPSNFCWRSN
jgi:hypothetical protein